MCGLAFCKSTVKVLLFAHPSTGAGKREPLLLVSVPLCSYSDGFGAFHTEHRFFYAGSGINTHSNFSNF